MEILKLGSKGPLVELVQSVFQKLGYYSGNIDSIFGYKTQMATKKFQQDVNLSVDGIIGKNTWNTLSPYINGYLIYTIKKGDTLFLLSQKYKTSVNRIITANPNINPENLIINQKIIIPYGNIIPTNISYSYNILKMNISSLKLLYPFIEVSSIGNSVLENSIPYIRIGNGNKQIFYNASFHANEWITSTLLMKFVEDYLIAYTDNKSIFGYSASVLFNTVSLYIVPMVNPDGVNLVTGEYPKNSSPYINTQNIANNYPFISFPSGWKANIAGVNLESFQFFNNF